ncbi:DUF2155 domain-containing protein [Oceanomicrobium pacificus]|uniref:DUF2155 domain-containing protein n=1 Tax=Oceanomicrobium pacificus TaxID=2692916 RepID=A0A6B0TVJ7_9RHOB|nr:DUF2155 domain-containing protein [Oceanomicrobium pacificus]MXU65795.1 DUF2155 domain-containing protein [Oceanomicrobium pacificus]
MRALLTPILFAALIGGPALAQDASSSLSDPSTTTAERERGEGARLRMLDTMSGVVTDLEVNAGEEIIHERLAIRLDSCLYPVGDPAADAFALLEIKDVREPGPRFTGWMFASSPALSAMDHPRYDVWVLSCTTS